MKVPVKVFHNKRNNQLSVSLPRKDLSFLDKKGVVPKKVFLKLSERDFEW